METPTSTVNDIVQSVIKTLDIAAPTWDMLD